MYYSVNEGMSNTFSDRFGSITDKLKGHNLLPVGVSALAVLWVGLIFATIQQTPVANPATPGRAEAASNTQPLSVTSQHTDGPTMTSSPASSNATTSSTTQAVQSPLAASASGQTLTPNVIGGKGGDGGGTSPPSTPVVTPPATGDSGADIGLTVDPIILDPITLDVGLDDEGLNLDLGL